MATGVNPGFANSRDENDEDSQHASRVTSPSFNEFITWSFGSGITGKRERQLNAPHTAEENPFDTNEILVAEEANHAVVIVDRRTETARVVYGERGVPGSGRRMHHVTSAHFLPEGPHTGQIIATEWQREHLAALTIICDERCRILSVNSKKELVWELGGASAEYRVPATPYALLPTYITTTSQGALLVTDWGHNMIYEMNPFCIPERKHKDAYLLKDFETDVSFSDSAVMESRGFLHKNVQVLNTNDSASVKWRLLASHNGDRWQVIHSPPAELAGGASDHAAIGAPWNFIKAQVRSTVDKRAASVDVFISMLR